MMVRFLSQLLHIAHKIHARLFNSINPRNGWGKTWWTNCFPDDWKHMLSETLFWYQRIGNNISYIQYHEQESRKNISQSTKNFWLAVWGSGPFEFSTFIQWSITSIPTSKTLYSFSRRLTKLEARTKNITCLQDYKNQEYQMFYRITSRTTDCGNSNDVQILEMTKTIGRDVASSDERRHLEESTLSFQHWQ